MSTIRDADPAVDRIAKRLRRLVADAKRAGVALVADAEIESVRVMTRDQLDEDDLRTVGETVEVHGGCGGSANTLHEACMGVYIPPKTRARLAAEKVRERAARVADAHARYSSHALTIAEGRIRALPLGSDS